MESPGFGSRRPGLVEQRERMNDLAHTFGWSFYARFYAWRFS
jgi:hypothetical protein